ncbi:hypothetical protein [Salipiger pallidus]|uniref:hypothetical protein n=1 Tax=Salipiger pallidus TaxID=1775170 RepID=UPI00166DA540|nr:hypothetical protein [Salipiger pallidus]
MVQLSPQRPKAPRSVAVTAPRPKPTAAAALLLSLALSAPFALVALAQVIF